jgi:pimeloyl-ACP methyl ester carboxylesterase
MHVERVLTFGPAKSLIGILCEPPKERAIAGAPAVITWNVGINHRVGPYRIYVDLARKLAELGFTSLRFDVSGLGDSEVDPADTRSDERRALGDVQDAMQTLREQRGIQQFVLVGFCSSVDAAHSLGAAAENVAGVIYVEGYGFRTRGYYLRYPLRLLDRNRWRRRLEVLLPTLFPEFFGEPLGTEREEVYVRDYPSPARFADDVKRMLARGVRLLFIYAGGDTTYTYRRQLFDMLGADVSEQRIDLDFQQHADHTFFVVADREHAVKAIVDWMTRRFGTRAQLERHEGSPPSNGAAGVKRVSAGP